MVNTLRELLLGRKETQNGTGAYIENLSVETESEEENHEDEKIFMNYKRRLSKYKSVSEYNLLVVICKLDTNSIPDSLLAHQVQPETFALVYERALDKKFKKLTLFTIR
ncbi:hypothetical protein ACTFIZ_007796 [Dictyostelium cf. discoideum]